MVGFSLGKEADGPSSYHLVWVREFSRWMDHRNKPEPSAHHTVDDDTTSHPWRGGISWFASHPNRSALCHTVCPASQVFRRIARPFPPADSQSFATSHRRKLSPISNCFAPFIFGYECTRGIRYTIPAGIWAKRFTAGVE